MGESFPFVRNSADDLIVVVAQPTTDLLQLNLESTIIKILNHDRATYSPRTAQLT